MTIEERAKDFAKGRRYTLTAYEAYIAGANDQKAVDEERIAKLESFIEGTTKLIRQRKHLGSNLETKEKKLIDKACKWLKENARDYACATIRYYGDEDEIICDVHQEIVEDFRKAIEEDL